MIIMKSGVHATGPLVQETRPAQGFNRVEIANAIHGEITLGDTTSVRLEGAADILPLIHTKLDGNSLKVYADHDYSTTTPVRVFITTPHLSSIEISGASHANVKGFSEAEFTAHASGASQLAAEVKATKLKGESTGASSIVLNSVNGGDVDLAASGASRIKLSGTCARLAVDASGSSHLDLASLKAESAQLSASGASSIKLEVTRTLKAEASGASRITYTGSPSVVQDVSGASSVNSG